MREELKVGKPIVVCVDITNKGNTPALNLKWKVAFDFTDNPEPIRPLTFSEDVKSSSGFIAKDGIAHMDTTSKARITNEEIDLFKQDKYRLYVWGIIEYKDFFGEFHTTHFCGFQTFGRGTELDVYWSGNEMT